MTIPTQDSIHQDSFIETIGLSLLSISGAWISFQTTRDWFLPTLETLVRRFSVSIHSSSQSRSLQATTTATTATTSNKNNNTSTKTITTNSQNTEDCGMPHLPSNVVKYSQVPKPKNTIEQHVFRYDTIPKGLLKEHNTRKGTWGVIRMKRGKLLYQINEPTKPIRQFVLSALRPESDSSIRNTMSLLTTNDDNNHNNNEQQHRPTTTTRTTMEEFRNYDENDMNGNDIDDDDDDDDDDEFYSIGIIEPQVYHQVKPLTKDVEFIVEFYRVSNTGAVHEPREGLKQ